MMEINEEIRDQKREKMPMLMKKCLYGVSEYSEDDNEHCYSDETFDTFNCHICNVEVPVLCFNRHDESEKHVALKTIFQKALERVSKQINKSVMNNDKDIDKNVYYCEVCCKIIKIENKLKHESSEYHDKSQRATNVVNEFYKIFEGNQGYVGAKEAKTEEILDEKRNLGPEIIQNDTKNNNVKDVTDKDISNSDETKTVSVTNDHTMKPTYTVENLVPNEEHNEELTTEDNYFKDMVEKYNLEVNLPIVNGEFIHVASPSGVKVKIPRDHFHSYCSVVSDYQSEIRVYCQMCIEDIELGEESQHKLSEKHAKNVFVPVNENFARTINDYYSHCLICNKVVVGSRLFQHYNNNHAKIDSTKITDNCQNNEDLASGIKTENIERIDSDNHVNKSEEKKINTCINDKKYDSGDHLNESGRTKDAASDKKLVFCKLCNVRVLQDQIEYHNAGTPHWSNALKNIWTGVAEGFQALLSGENLKADSDLSEKPNDTVIVDHLDNQTNISENLTKRNDIPKNDNVTKQNDIPKIDNVTKQNDIPKNDNATKQNDIPKNDNVTKQNDIPKGDNETKQKDIPKNDNVTKQNDIPKNDNVTKPNDIPKNDDVTKQNDIPKNENIASTSLSNIAYFINNDIDSSPFRYADLTKNKVTCMVCDINIANVLQSIKNHEASSSHELWLRKLLKFHTIRKNSNFSFCECCCNGTVSNIWAHIGTEQHTALLQLEYEIDSKTLKLYVHKSKVRNNHGIMCRELYKMMLESNKISKLPNSNFFCSFCEIELCGKGDEIDHMFSAAHEEWLKKVFKSR